jgi:hypothetical protein
MSFNIKVNPKKQLRLKENLVHNKRTYLKGHLFHVIGDDPMRGYDIEDSKGNQIYEIRMIMDKFEEI